MILGTYRVKVVKVVNSLDLGSALLETLSKDQSAQARLVTVGDRSQRSHGVTGKWGTVNSVFRNYPLILLDLCTLR